MGMNHPTSPPPVEKVSMCWLTTDEWKLLSQKCDIVALCPNQKVFTADVAVDCLVYVLKGALVLTRTSGDTMRLAAGTAFNFVGVHTPVPLGYDCNAADEDTVLLRVSKANVRAVSQLVPEFSAKFFYFLSSNLAIVMKEVNRQRAAPS